MKLLFAAPLLFAALLAGAQDNPNPDCNGFSPVPPECQNNNINGGGESLGGAGLGTGGPSGTSISGLNGGGFSQLSKPGALSGGGAGAALGALTGGGTVGGQSAGDVNVPPTAADIPAGCPTPGRNVVMKRVYPGQGSTELLFDQPPPGGVAPTIYAFRLPTWGGRMAHQAGFIFAEDTVRAVGAKIAFSRCPGDFSWGKAYTYHTPTTKPHTIDPATGCFLLGDGESSAQYPGHSCYGGAFTPATASKFDENNPCYHFGAGYDFNMAYQTESGGYNQACIIPPQPDGHTWYMNVQFIDDKGESTCPRAEWQCNNVFNWHGGSLDALGWGHGNDYWAEKLPYEAQNEFYGSGQIANHYRPQSGWDGYCTYGGGQPNALEPGCKPRQ